MYKMRESWTDERLDDFRDEVNRRFDDVDKRFDGVDRRFEGIDQRFDKVDKRLDAIDGELKALNQVIAKGAVALTSAIIGGFAAMIGLVATQL
jgi:tetrahydromethanopterin S-methyltransferase subunit G